MNFHLLDELGTLGAEDQLAVLLVVVAFEDVLGVQFLLDLGGVVDGLLLVEQSVGSVNEGGVVVLDSEGRGGRGWRFLFHVQLRY